MGLIKQWRTALKKHSEGLAWSAIGGVAGAGIGLVLVTAWGHTVGW